MFTNVCSSPVYEVKIVSTFSTIVENVVSIGQTFCPKMRSSNHIHCIKTFWKMLIESARIMTKMLLYTLLLSFYVTSPVLGLMKVSTYNLWNIMFNWDVRKYRIARMVSRLFLLSYLDSAPG